MISIEFRRVGAGTCQWCGKEKDEVFGVVFADKSFAGDYCKADLIRAIKNKCQDAKPAPVAQPVGNGPVLAAK